MARELGKSVGTESGRSAVCARLTDISRHPVYPAYLFDALCGPFPSFLRRADDVTSAAIHCWCRLLTSDLTWIGSIAQGEGAASLVTHTADLDTRASMSRFAKRYAALVLCSSPLSCVVAVCTC